MNRKPVSYKQYSAAWNIASFKVGEGTMTVRGSGCGPTSAAMLVSTLTGKEVTPRLAYSNALNRGYMVLNQGLNYYKVRGEYYFDSFFRLYNLDCHILNWINTYGKKNSPNRELVESMLDQGYYFIVLMNKGLWTSSGHFVVLWDHDGSEVKINDPASQRPERNEHANADLFFSQAKYFWAVDARDYNHPKKKEEIEVVRYNTIEEIEHDAAWAVPTVKKLNDLGILTGTGKGFDLSMDMLRILVMNDRSGVYDR